MTWNTRNPQFVLLMLIFAVTFMFSCRSRKKSATLQEGQASLAVTVLDLRSEDKSQNNFRYVLKGCGEDSSAGVVDTTNETGDPVVKFKLKGVEEGDVCSMDVKIDSLEAYPNEIKFTDENLLMYKGTNAYVSKDLTGGFIASVNMKPNYFHEVSPLRPDLQYTLSISVSFPAPLSTGTIVSPFIYCKPEINHLPGVYSASSATTGTVSFKVVHSGGTADQHSCSKINVFSGDERTHFAKINSEVFKYAATAGQSINFNGTVVNLQKVPAPPSNVILQTIEGKQCDPAKEVFDINKRICVPRNNSGQ